MSTDCETHVVVHVKPSPSGVVCEVHDEPSAGLWRRIVDEMKRRRPAGVDVCRDCLARARDSVLAQAGERGA